MLLTAPILTGNSCKTEEEEQKMNILYIFCDDLNDWTTVLGGHPQAITPNIERLAQRAVTFTNAHCPSPASGPSRASIMTGYYPPKTKVLGNADNFRNNPETANAVTLPQYFAANGYTTVAAGKIFHQPRGSDDEPNVLSDDQSWQHQWRGNVGTRAPIPFPPQELEIPVNDYFSTNFVWGACPEPLEETFDYQLSKYIAGILQEKHEKPFLAACGIFRPHLSWFVPQQFIDMYNLDDIILPETLEEDLNDIPAVGRQFVKPLVHDALVRQNKWKEAVRAYLASITYADYCIGILLDALENSEYKDNTIVILMGDHGWHLGEKKHWSKFTLWERATRTTFMIQAPGISHGRCDAPVNLLDLYPTLIELNSLPPKSGLQGHSLVPLLKDVNATWNRATLTYFNHAENYSIRDKSWRYIHYYDGTEELYNHDTDPNEWENIAGDARYRDKIRELREKSGLGDLHKLN